MGAPRAAILGAGIAGLAAARRLVRGHAAPMPFEAVRRVGGRVEGAFGSGAALAGARIETFPRLDCEASGGLC